MKYNLLNKTGLYRECEEFCLVKVIEQTENDWGITLRLRVTENKFATENDDDEMEYIPKTNYREEFTVSGAWDIVGLTDDIFTISYVGVRINFRQASIDAFNRNEPEMFILWFRK